MNWVDMLYDEMELQPEWIHYKGYPELDAKTFALLTKFNENPQKDDNVACKALLDRREKILAEFGNAGLGPRGWGPGALLLKNPHGNSA